MIIFSSPTIRLILLFFFFTINGMAQVGIGTTSPHQSSILDVNSNSKGLLAPRMTTAQRTAISSPAESLLVYDTDMDAFYYYESTSATWIRINAGNIRNNYKLVKSAADLAPELAAGGGTKYLLTSNTYYEINGTIVLSVPIDLNEAYVSGLDANEDILYTTGTAFQGSTGGSIRNVTITGGGTAFNISGSGLSGSSTLLIQNSIVYGMASVGTISNIGLYFGNVVQFVGNTNGVTYTNIGNLLLNNQAWTSTNTGTFEKLTGTFGLVQKVSGFTTVNSPSKGFDVSANPSVSRGVMLSTVFTGTGTYVSGYSPPPYSGYNFSTEWNVDCPGIPEESDKVASAQLYFANENLSVSNVLVDNTPIKMVGTTTAGNLFRMTTDGGVNNRIKYMGAKQRNFTITASATVERSSNGSKNVYSLLVYKNGSVVPSIIADQTFENGVSKANFTVVGSLLLNTNDFIEVYISTDDNTIDPTVKRFNLVIE